MSASTAPPSPSSTASSHLSPFSSLPATPLSPTPGRSHSISGGLGWCHISSKALETPPQPYFAGRTERHGSFESYFYREDDGPNPAGVPTIDEDAVQGEIFPPPPHTTITGPPSTIGLCDGRKGDMKNNGNLCAMEYFGSELRCFYCGRDLK